MSKPGTKDREALREELRAAGLRATPARLAVLAAVRRASGPLTHSQVCTRVRRQGFDKATVFRNLVTLADEGFLRRTDLGDHVWRFEAISEGEAEGVVHEHPHFLCTGCGTVECIPSIEVKVRGRKDLPRAVRRRDIEVQLKGLCDACLD